MLHWARAMENRHGLLVDACLTQADGHAERVAALHMIEPRADRPTAITLGADKAYDVEDFVNELRSMNVTPHVAQNTSGRRSTIDGRTTRHGGYAVSQRIRSGSRRHSAGSRRSRGNRRPGSVAVTASHGPLPSLPPTTIWCGCPSGSRRPADGQGARLRQGLCRPLAHRRDGRLDNEYLDLLEEAHLTFQGKSNGEIAFGALKSFLDVRYGTRDGSACAEFSWEGHDENDPSCGRGWL